jgi:uncharacterized OsmC-like protein
MHDVIQGEALAPEGARRAIELAGQRYCSVAASLRPQVGMGATFEIAS